MLFIQSNNVQTFPSFAAFPVSGEEDVIYIDDATNIAYRWDGAAYQSISGSGGGGGGLSFYLERVETIDNVNAAPVEYFTTPQNGTEISNQITLFTHESFNIDMFIVCANTSTGGIVEINPQINGVNLLAQPYLHEPKDTSNVFYVHISKQKQLSGTNSIQIQLSNQGGGTARIIEANAIITEV